MGFKRPAKKKVQTESRKGKPLSKFRALTPLDTMEDVESYTEALDYAFSNSSVHNIALSGTYGSGKSSIMLSYERTHPDKKFIHISLARFEEQGDKDRQANDSKQVSAEESTATPEMTEKKTVSILEGKILNQLLHQIDPKQIPQSNFRVKTEPSPMKRIFSVLGIILVVMLLLYQFCFDAWATLVNQLECPLLECTVKPCFRLISLIALFVLLFIFLNSFAKSHNFQNIFKKVDVKGIVGIEVFETEDDSYFDKYLNEVLYLFDNTEADAIVFEDLDRYDVTQIFAELREINDLINNKRHQESKPPLRFFYLIRDDVFTSSDRNKFFDFIIPVVPVIDTSNSYEKLAERFRELDMAGDFDNHFLQGISLYLSDMRLMMNMVNEYVVYRERLMGRQLKMQEDRLFAMIVYKNLFPEDFALLQQGRGYVHELFTKKEGLVHKRSEEITTFSWH